MTENRSRLDKYEQYEQLFDPLLTDRKARRHRKLKAKHVPKVVESQIVEDIADTVEIDNGFITTYQPSRYESGWLLSALRTFYDQALITDVLAVVKGGKEASVYRCAAHERFAVELLAAKVYRPRMFRSLSNDAMYREGRQLLTEEGRPVKTTDHRTLRAVGKKTAFGVQVAHTSWMMHEYTTLARLYKAGGAVPRPVAISENAILMGYLGDDYLAAPTLAEIRLAKADAAKLFQEVLRNIELMLKLGMIHGDLSAYNILYWEGKITLIDFPQVTNSQTNRNAAFILRRDIQRICEYFVRQGVACDAASIMTEMADKYLDSAAFDMEDSEDQADSD